ncbi:MAG: sulfur carrier protein ThiS [Nitrospirae bacterium]|jgi:sulfur carrier protein|nr:sulfur carrier protein ThiS [Nitrospirota bacterium]
MATIQLNGKTEEIGEVSTLSQLLQQKGFDPALVSVELNGRIVEKEEWDVTPLHGEDEVEILFFMGGGGMRGHSSGA